PPVRRSAPGRNQDAYCKAAASALANSCSARARRPAPTTRPARPTLAQPTRSFPCSSLLGGRPTVGPQVLPCPQLGLVLAAPGLQLRVDARLATLPARQGVPGLLPVFRAHFVLLGHSGHLRCGRCERPAVRPAPSLWVAGSPATA